MLSKLKKLFFPTANRPDLKFPPSVDFLNPKYQLINVARLQHLESLGLDLSYKSVIEYGAGIGDHTLFYLYKNCRVLPIEGRKNLAAFLSKRLDLKVETVNLETELEKIENIKEHFDIAHCYGILYHLSNPKSFLKTASKTAEMLLLETCVSDDEEYAITSDINIVSEDKDLESQAISGKGCRPDRAWVFNELKKHYKFVYLPKTQPKHEQFPVNWGAIGQNSSTGLVRSVFVASNTKIKSETLTDRLITNYQAW